MFDDYLFQKAELDTKLFALKHNLTDEIRERMRKVIEEAPHSIMKKDNQSILRYAYTKALSKEK